MKQFIISVICSTTFIFIAMSSLAQNQGDPIINGHLYKIFSKILNEERTLLIHLPDGYEKSRKRYPVILQLDGYEQIYLSRLAEAKRLLEEDLIPEFIYVAVANIDRNRDMYPFKTPYHRTAGGADNFVKFISDELIPYINTKFRTSSHKTLIGFSASGLFTFYYFLTKPETFDAYLACSPALSFDTDYFVKKLENMFNNYESLDKTLAFVYGESEGNSYYGDQYYFNMHKCLGKITNILKNKSPRGLDWSVTPIIGGLHVPHGCVYEGLKKVFLGWQPFKQPEIIPAGGFNDFGEGLSITIKSTDNDIYYTKDGSEPSKQSMKYEGILIINDPLTIKAKIFGERYGESRTTVAKFEQSDIFRNIIVDGELTSGLKYYYYEDYFFRSSLPDFDNLNIIEFGTTDRINIGMKKRYEGFAVAFEGLIEIPSCGNYTFSLSSNNESKLCIDDKVIVYKEFDYEPNEKTGNAPLEEGLHKINVYYVGPPFMKKLDLALLIEGPGIEKQEIPVRWLYHIK